MNKSFPCNNELKINELSRIFDNKSESYKLFWFCSLLSHILNEKNVISFNEIINDMISTAWYMVSEYHLNLGTSDTMEKLILSLDGITPLKPSETKENIVSNLNAKKESFKTKFFKCTIAVFCCCWMWF